MGVNLYFSDENEVLLVGLYCRVCLFLSLLLPDVDEAGVLCVMGLLMLGSHDLCK